MSPTAAKNQIGTRIDLIDQLHVDTDAIAMEAKRPSLGRRVAELMPSDHVVPLDESPIDRVVARALAVREYEVTGAHNPHRPYPSARAMGGTEGLRLDGLARLGWYEAGRNAWRTSTAAGAEIRGAEVDGTDVDQARTRQICLVADPFAQPAAYGSLRYALAALELGHATWSLALAIAVEGELAGRRLPDDRVEFSGRGVPVPSSFIAGPTWNPEPESEPWALAGSSSELQDRVEAIEAIEAIEAAARLDGNTIPLAAVVDHEDRSILGSFSGRANSGRCYKGLTPAADVLDIETARADADRSARPALEFSDSMPPLITITIARTADGWVAMPGVAGELATVSLPNPSGDEVQGFCNSPSTGLRVECLDSVVLHVVHASHRHDAAALKRSLLEAGARTQRLALHLAADRNAFCRPIKSYVPERLGSLGRSLSIGDGRYVAYAALTGRSSFEDLRVRLDPSMPPARKESRI